jgi:hypothetical protein
VVENKRVEYAEVTSLKGKVVGFDDFEGVRRTAWRASIPKVVPTTLAIIADWYSKSIITLSGFDDVASSLPPWDPVA